MTKLEIINGALTIQQPELVMPTPKPSEDDLVPNKHIRDFVSRVKELEQQVDTLTIKLETVTKQQQQLLDLTSLVLKITTKATHDKTKNP